MMRIKFVAGTGVEPVSGDYEPPEVAVPLPRVPILVDLKFKSIIDIF